MPRIVREAESLGREPRPGRGAITAASSGAFTALPFARRPAMAARGEDEPGGAARGSPWRVLRDVARGELSKAGTPPERLDVRCVDHDGRGRGKGHQIVHSAIDAQGTVAGLRRTAFGKAAEAADAGCPFSALSVRAHGGVGSTLTRIAREPRGGN